MAYRDLAARKQNDREYYLAHREAKIAAAGDWAKANPEKRRAVMARQYAWQRAKRRDARLTPAELAAVWPLRDAASRGRAVLRAAEWADKNRERALANKRATQMRRRGRAQSAAGDASPSQIEARVAYYGGLCWMCGESADTVDHVIPLARGGANWPANLRPACMRCNSSKSDRMVV